MSTEEKRQIVQRISREILAELVVFCERHNIEYFMMYGSLLGAIRHEGMIPWDDDIDVAMTRENYFKFLDCVQTYKEELLMHNDLEITGSGSAKYMSEIKIGRRGTKYCAKIGEDLDINKLITVDIFCVDYLKPCYVKDIEHKNLFRLFLSIAKLKWPEKRFMMRVFKQRTGRTKYFRVLSLYLMHIIRVLFTEKGIEHFIYKHTVDETKTSKYMGVVMCSRRPIYFSAGFKLIKVGFDGIQVNIPDNYDEILAWTYGDYMTPPPVNERQHLDVFETVLEVN